MQPKYELMLFDKSWQCSFSEYLAQMAHQHDAIMARSFKRQEQIKKSQAQKAGHHATFEPQMIAFSQTKKTFYQKQNLKVDYQLAFHRIRKQLGLSQRAFAKRLEIELKQVEAIEAGKVLPTMDELLKLATVSGQTLRISFE